MRITVMILAVGCVGVVSVMSMRPSSIGVAHAATELASDSCIVALTGDVNLSGAVTSGDIIYLLNYVFIRGPEPQPCTYAGDVNCNAMVTSSDVIGLINYVFKSGDPPCDICAAEKPFDCVL